MDSFKVDMTGKYVRFRTSYNATNLSSLAKLNNSKSSQIPIAAGAVGVIIEVRGGTIWIGLSRDLKSAPGRGLGKDEYAAIVDYNIGNIGYLEIDI